MRVKAAADQICLAKWFSGGVMARGGRTIPLQAAPLTPAEAVPPQRRNQSLRGLALMALGMFLFSAVDTGAKFLTAELHAFQIVWTRQLGLLAGAFVLIAIKGRAILRTRHPRLQVARGTVAACSAALFIFGVGYVPLADAVAITFVAPFLVTVMGAIILREPVGLRRWVAVAIGFLGAMVVIRPGTGVVHPAAFLLILAAFFFACRQIISRSLSDSDRTGTTVVYTALVGSSILTIPVVFVWQVPTVEQAAILIGIAVLAGVAEVMVIMALERAMAVVVAPVMYTLMIWGTFYGFVVFGQLPDGWTLLGAAIIVGSGLYTLWREYLVSRSR
ncbi:MAG: DMT family transporter [Pseudomonadota bacterium]